MLAKRGIAYVCKHDFNEADKDLSAAAALDPNDRDVARARGLMAELNGDCAKAIDFYTRSLNPKWENPFTLSHRAACEAAVSKTDEALADLALVLNSDPTSVDIRVQRANIYIRQGKRDLVAAEAEALTRDNPASDSAWVAAGRAYAGIGQRDRPCKHSTARCDQISSIRLPEPRSIKAFHGQERPTCGPRRGPQD